LRPPAQVDPINPEKAVGTAKYAKYAKTENLAQAIALTRMVSGLLSLNLSDFAYFAYFAV
jgi:hypothetical protein